MWTNDVLFTKHRKHTCMQLSHLLLNINIYPGLTAVHFLFLHLQEFSFWHRSMPEHPWNRWRVSAGIRPSWHSRLLASMKLRRSVSSEVSLKDACRVRLDRERRVRSRWPGIFSWVWASPRRFFFYSPEGWQTSTWWRENNENPSCLWDWWWSHDPGGCGSIPSVSTVLLLPPLYLHWSKTSVSSLCTMCARVKEP